MLCVCIQELLMNPEKKNKSVFALTSLVSKWFMS